MRETDARLVAFDEHDWTARAEAHAARLAPTIDPYFEARRRGQRQPVLDFLFDYYGFRRSRLLTWSPGIGRVLLGDRAIALLRSSGKRQRARPPSVRLAGRVELSRTTVGGQNGVRVDPAKYPERRRPTVRWILELLEQTQARVPHFGCFGMHEWAMVYRTEDLRHGHLPLRMPPDELASFVESQPIRCTHWDAFRFFTEPARPLNRVQPTMEGMRHQEQPGCIHANMDVYRWAAKLWPWIAGDVMVEAFELACRAREIDMQASPYDLRAHGYAPIPIETAEGRRAYVQHQQELAAAARPVRARLIAETRRLVAALDTTPAAR